MAQRGKAKRGVGGAREESGDTEFGAGSGRASNVQSCDVVLGGCGRALKFYAGALGFRVIEEFVHEGRMVYARLRSPGSDSTLAVHQLEPGRTVPQGEGVRLYFETRNLEALCKKLEESGTALDRPPKLERWGWTHAYLRDPDGHELSFVLGRGAAAEEFARVRWRAERSLLEESESQPPFGARARLIPCHSEGPDSSPAPTEDLADAAGGRGPSRLRINKPRPYRDVAGYSTCAAAEVTRILYLAVPLG